MIRYSGIVDVIVSTYVLKCNVTLIVINLFKVPTSEPTEETRNPSPVMPPPEYEGMTMSSSDL